jgi:hypothetical protein
MSRKSLPANRNSRSIEEIVLKRKLEENDHFLPTFSKTVSFPPISAGENSISRGEKSRILTGQFMKEAKYSDEDVRKMMDEVMKYCRSLQFRIQDLETQLIHLNKNKTLRADGPPTTEDLGSSHGVRFSDYVDQSETVVKPTKLRPLSGQRQSSMLAGKQITSIANDLVVDIDHKVSYLREIFKKTDPIEARKLSAIKIQALIRRFLVRVRKLSYEASMREWRWIRCRPVVWLLDILLANQSKLDSGFHLLTMNRVMRTLKTIFGKWAVVTRQNSPMRRTTRQLAEEKILKKRKQLLTLYFEAFKSVTIGRISLKNANQQRREMIDKIRKDLSEYLKEKGLVGIVPPHEITKMLHRRVIDEFKVRKRVIVLKGILNRLKKLISMSKQFEKKSAEFRFRKLVGKCFYSWSDYTYLSSLGLDRKRWPGPRKYEVRRDSFDSR